MARGHVDTSERVGPGRDPIRAKDARGCCRGFWPYRDSREVELAARDGRIVNPEARRRAELEPSRPQPSVAPENLYVVASRFGKRLCRERESVNEHAIPRAQAPDLQLGGFSGR
jgi:hypothetical protein